MERYKISRLLNDSTVSKFMTRKWVEVNDLRNDQYSINKNIRLKTPILWLGLCDYSDAYIVVKRRINVEGTANANTKSKKLTLKNNAPFTILAKIYETNFSVSVK